MVIDLRSIRFEVTESYYRVCREISELSWVSTEVSSDKYTRTCTHTNTKFIRLTIWRRHIKRLCDSKDKTKQKMWTHYFFIVSYKRRLYFLSRGLILVRPLQNQVFLLWDPPLRTSYTLQIFSYWPRWGDAVTTDTIYSTTSARGLISYPRISYSFLSRSWGGSFKIISEYKLLIGHGDIFFHKNENYLFGSSIPDLHPVRPNPLTRGLFYKSFTPGVWFS